MSPDTPPRFQLALDSASVGTESPEIEKIQRYLTRFGYLSDTITPGTLDQATSDALRSFQRVAGLEASGELDSATAEALQLPRCGSPDTGTVRQVADGESSNFVLRGCSYPKQAFTFRFVNGTADLAANQERDPVRAAFATWATALCGVTFTEVAAEPSDFDIGWFTGNHGDGSNFDGVGNVLAHAFYPPPCGGAHAGDLHFDDAESWSLTGAGGTFDAQTVALHEIGHLLGLDHSTVNTAVMAPFYAGPRRALTQDDLDGIRRLYPFVCRRGDSGAQAGFVSEIAAARHRQHQVVNAVRTQAGTLKLIAWNVAAGGAVTRTGDSGNLAGAATSIDLARDGSTDRFVSVCRNGSGRLFLISWNVNVAGAAITRLGDSGGLAGEADLIRVVSVGNGRFVTACRAASGDLKLIGWRLEAAGGLTRLADSGNQAGAIQDLDLVDLPGSKTVTAVRAASGDLKVISWNVTDGAITRLADSANLAGNARIIKAAVDQAGHVVTAVKAADDSLKLITWNVAAGGVITRLGDSGGLAGETQGHDVSLAGGRIVTPVRAGDGNLKVIVWQTNAAGAVARVGDSDGLAGDATLPTSCDELSGAPAILTSVRTASNSLKLISWSTP